MTSFEVPERCSRRTLADLVLQLLEDPTTDRGCAQSAASLLRSLCARADAPRIEVILLDPTTDPWTVVGLLRTFARSDLELSDAGFGAVCADLAAQDGATWPRLQQLGNLIAAASDEQRPAAMETVESLAGDGARRLLMSGLLRRDPTATGVLDTLYRAALDAGALDAELAWRTFERPESQASLLDGPGRKYDTRKLRGATRSWSFASLDALFESRPEALERALVSLALPAAYLRARFGPAGLESAATAALGNVRCVASDAAMALRAARPDGAEALDALLARDDLNERDRERISGHRLNCSERPAYATLPARALRRHLLRLREPQASDRTLLAWAADQGGAFGWLGLRGLLRLGAPMAPGRVQRALSSAEPATRQVAWEYLAARGDDGAKQRLVRAAVCAPHVVLRAHALGSLRRLPAPPLGLFAETLRGSHETYASYYAPTACEAAMGLVKRPGLAEDEALPALVHASLTVENDDMGPTLLRVLQTWVGGAPPRLSPVWDHRYAEEIGSV